MDKYIKFFLISFFILCLIPSKQLNAQPDVTPTQVDPNGAVAGIGQQFAIAGFRSPLTKKEQRLRKKGRRLSLSRKQLNIYNRKIRNKELKFFEKLRFPFIKRKYEKLENLQKQADALKYDRSSSAPAGSKPGYLEPPPKYQLSIKEKEVINKYDQDSSSLDKKELKLYKKAVKKQDKADKYLSKYRKTPLDAQDSLLISLYLNHPDSLSSAEKQAAKKAIKVRKQNRKIDDKIRNYQVDSALANGGWVPVTQRNFSPKRFFQRFKPKEKPSRYVRKQRRINRRFGLTDRQKTALNNKQRIVRPVDRYRVRRAEVKNYLHQKRTEKLLKREYIKSLSRKNKRTFRKNVRASKKNQSKYGTYKRNQKFLNLFKKRQ
ncbi:MAG: hypothetical protein JXR68_01005 [Bacteroidales bacterium]|nr:hypothetical protein [Bacteroidales bacterium]